MSVLVELQQRAQAMIAEDVASHAERPGFKSQFYEGEVIAGAVVAGAVAGLADPRTAAPVTADTP